MNKYVKSFFITFFISGLSFAQQIDTTNFSEKYYHRKSNYENMPNKGGEIIFFGNSITEQGTWLELFENPNIINRGIGGDTTDGLLSRVDEVIASKPIKVFILIGTNDLKFEKSPSYIVDKINAIVQKISKESPLTEIYLQSVLPTLERPERPIESIKEINSGLQSISNQENVFYLDLFSHFALAQNGEQLIASFTRDGLHLNGKGYLKWKEIIQEFVKDTPQAQLKRNLKRIKDVNNPYVFVIAHRGDWRNYPENSTGSLTGAIDMGVDIVEIDLQMTKDNKIVVFHDSNLERMTNGNGKLSGLTYQELKKLNLKNGLSHKTDYKIPLFEDYLKMAKDKVILDLDIKTGMPFQEVGQLLEKYNMFDQVIVRSYRSYDEARNYYGNYLDSLNYFPGIRKKNIKNPQKYIQTFEKHINPIAYVPSFKEFDTDFQEIFKLISNNDDKIWVHTIIDDSRSGGHWDDNSLTDIETNYGWLIENNIRFVQTDRPQLLINYLRNKNLHD